MSPYPQWLDYLAWSYLIVCFVCGGYLLADELHRPQKMWIMNIVWPVSALYFGPFGVWLYRKMQPAMVKHPEGLPMALRRTERAPAPEEQPTPWQVSAAVFHCGAGCTLGDIAAETFVFATGLALVGEFGSELLYDFILAFSLGMVFQYFTIVPLRGLSFGEGLKAALRADTVSIVLFEVGLFTWMALQHFVLFPQPHLHPNEALFWFNMQVGMILGFFTAYPANAWLIRKGWKEKMPNYDSGEQGEEKQAA